MIPLKDNIRLERWPIVTLSLIILNISVFIYQLSLGIELFGFLQRYAIIPTEFFARGEATLQDGSTVPAQLALYRPLLTSMFLHGGWLHLLGNMLYLWIFGDNIEDRLGRWRFLLFYLACGILAACAHLIMNSQSEVPSVGASGAVSGVLGAYLLLYPRARVLTVLPVFFFLQMFELPAGFFIGVWVIQQCLYGTLEFINGGSQIAWWAHIGGFLAGLALLLLLVRPVRLNVQKIKYASAVYLPSLPHSLVRKDEQTAISIVR
ncbi:MAG: rhomboid family intramembrane serine protease [Acidobacteriota bacterium]